MSKYNEIILITGVAGFWGAQLAKRLIELSERRAANGREGVPAIHIIGLDVEAPNPPIQDLDFIQADIRNPLLVDLLKAEQVKTVCHLVFMDSAKPTEASFDINVVGTMKVLSACGQAGVRKVVLKSSTAVYGACQTNPAFLTEQHPLHGSRAYGYTRDMVEIEAFCNGFQRQVPEMILTILRFPSIVGLNVDTPMTRFLRQSWTPVLLGFDPLMQVIHEWDVIEALVHAILKDVPGVFNVAAEGVLPLMRLMSLAGKIPIPIFHPFAYWGASTLGATGLRITQYVPIELDYIRYPWVADLAGMRERFGFTPHYTAEEALREFAGKQRLRKYMPESVTLAYDEERLQDTIERRRRMRSQQSDLGINTKSEG
jgi:UDP-glucose 4-epimerase